MNMNQVAQRAMGDDMKKQQRGVIELLTIYAMVAVGVLLVIGGLGLAVKIQTSRLATMTDKYNTFVATTKAIGDLAAKDAKKKTDADKLAKEKSDAEQKKLMADNAALGKRLRNAYSNRSAVSQLSPSTIRPDLACFSRTELDAAIGNYQSEILGITEKSAASTIDLNIGKAWIKEQSGVK